MKSKIFQSLKTAAAVSCALLGAADAANLHIFEEDALRLGEDHFAVLAFVDGINHGLSDFARLTARNGTV